MRKHINGDYEAICKTEGICKITTIYTRNKATNKIVATYTCYNDACGNYECAANGGTDDKCFDLVKLINVL